MTLFRIGVKPSRRAAARFVEHVRRSLQQAVVEEGDRSKITQSDIARSIGVHRSVISRELNGRADMTLGRVAELAWALGRTVNFSLETPNQNAGLNVPPILPGAIVRPASQGVVAIFVEKEEIKTSTTSGTRTHFISNEIADA